MRLRELLLTSRLLDETTLRQAEAHAAQTQSSLVRVLVAFKVVDARKLARVLSKALSLEVIDVASITIHPRLLELVPRHAAEQLRVLPIGVQHAAHGARLFLAMSDPSNGATIDIVEKATGYFVEPLVCDDAVLQTSLDTHYVVVEPAVLVGSVVAGTVDDGNDNNDYLTESTAEALQLLQAVRVGDDRRATSAALGENTAEVQRPRPVSIGFGDVPTAVHAQPFQALPVVFSPVSSVFASPPKSSSSMAMSAVVPTVPSARLPSLSPEASSPPTRRVARPFVDNEPTLAQDELLFDDDGDGPRLRTDGLHEALLPSSDESLGEDVPTVRRFDVREALATVPSSTQPQRRVIVAVRDGNEKLRRELLNLIPDVELLADDVAAAHRAHDQRALVLIEPLAKSTLLRAMLDLEEATERPRIVVVGGAPAFAVLAFVDHHLAAPDDPRALAVAVAVGLRAVGAL